MRARKYKTLQKLYYEISILIVCFFERKATGVIKCQHSF